MAVKYSCPICGRRYVEWGAKKLEFKCPDCEGQELARIGAGEEKNAKKPSLKRRLRAAAAARAAEAASAEPDPDEDADEAEEAPEEHEDEEVKAVGEQVEELEESDGESSEEAEESEEDPSEALAFDEVDLSGGGERVEEFGASHGWSE